MRPTAAAAAHARRLDPCARAPDARLQAAGCLGSLAPPALAAAAAAAAVRRLRGLVARREQGAVGAGEAAAREDEGRLLRVPTPCAGAPCDEGGHRAVGGPVGFPSQTAAVHSRAGGAACEAEAAAAFVALDGLLFLLLVLLLV